MKVKKIGEYGKKDVMEAIHLPVNGVSRGWYNHSLKTLISLIKKGDEHGKTERLLIASLKITAPRYIWAELDTYSVGVTPGSSTSTMYTLLKELEEVEEGQLQNLHNRFTSYTSKETVKNFYELYLKHKDTQPKNELLVIMKANLPEGFLQTRVKQFSYQTLRRMYKQRKSHRLEWWREFFDELIPQLDEQVLIKNTWM